MADDARKTDEVPRAELDLALAITRAVKAEYDRLPEALKRDPDTFGRIVARHKRRLAGREARQAPGRD